MTLLHARSVGREINLWKPGSGVVHGVFDSAVNLVVEGELWTLLAAGRHDSPFGIRLAPDACRARLDVRPGDRVHVRAGHVGLGEMVIDCRMASRWAPTPWRQPAPGLDARLDAMSRIASARAWKESVPMAGAVIDALHRSDDELAVVVRRTVGRGPGLTPAGDDVLVGILAVLTSHASGSAGAHATSRLAAALAPVLDATPDVSRYLLDQAARGLPGCALQELGKALIEAAPADVSSARLDRLLDTGATSGADACVGLIAACRFSFTCDERAAA